MLRKIRIVACGTFDLLHPGHLAFLENARRLSKNSELVVVVARNTTVIKEKGEKPVLGERERLKIVSSLKPVDKAVLGSTKDKLKTIEKLRPDILVLGYDQSWDEKELEEELKKRGLKVKVVRLKKYGNFSSSLLKKRIAKRYA